MIVVPALSGSVPPAKVERVSFKVHRSVLVLSSCTHIGERAGEYIYIYFCDFSSSRLRNGTEWTRAKVWFVDITCRACID